MGANGEARILLVEDNPVLAQSYVEFLRDQPYDVSHVDLGRTAIESIESDPPDLILLDLELPDMHGFSVLEHIKEHNLPSAVIIVTAHGSMKVAIDAMRAGAVDFLVKPFNTDRLIVTVRNTVERQQLSQLVQSYREIDRKEYGGFIGSSLAMQGVYRTIESASASKATVFITGESGTGKELCAQAVHRGSPRADKPFIALNCAAIPRELMESEIFGHVKGAFTGATSNREGAAALADGGTLFLDEICEMDLELQSKLLRFIQTESFLKVGGSTQQQVDVRFICATNRDPLVEVQEGRFREDLYYRLHVIPIALPPLRERAGDVIEIAERLLQDFSAQEGKGFQRFDPEVEAAFRRFPWPGNIRQLENVIRNIVVLHDGAAVTMDMIPAPLNNPDAAVSRDSDAATTPQVDGGSGDGRASPPQAAQATVPANDIAALSRMIRPLAEVERAAIEQALDLCGGNVRTAATLLGIGPATIYRKKAQWGRESGG